MKLRTRFIVIMAGFILLLTALSVVISIRLLLSNSIAFEEELVREALEGGRHFLAAEEQRMANLARDWANWDDTYRFMADTNDAFIDANLVPNTFQSLDLNLIALFDSTGGLFHAMGYDSQQKTEIAPPDDLIRKIREADHADRPLSGLQVAGPNIWLIAREPILTSQGDGPARGVLVMSRLLNNAGDWCPSRHWHGLFSLHPLPPDSGRPPPLEIRPVSLGLITGRIMLRDLSGAPALRLETSFPRRILGQGLAGEFFLAGWILLSGAAVALFAFWIVDRWVLRDLSGSVEALKQGLTAVTERANLKFRLKSLQNGEMKELVACLNDMLAVLDKAHEASEAGRRDLIQAQKMTALGTLVAGVAHEVNNPASVIGLNLTALQRRLERLQTGEGGAEQREALYHEIGVLLEETREATRRISAIAASLKGFARPSTGRKDAVLDLNVLVEKAGELLKHTVAKSGCLLTCRLAQPPPRVRGNEQQLSQVLVNLIENACQASPRPGAPVTLTTEYAEDGMVSFTVADAGTGIQPENLDRIFEPFFTTRRQQGGTGLGLSISLEIIQAHGGKIAVRSEPDNGSAFTVRLPAVNEDTP